MSDKSIRPDVIGGYQMTPKFVPTGAGRINPIRSTGEAESRNTITRMNHARLLESNQLQQVLMPRGIVSDVDSSIFSPDNFAERHGYSPDTFAPANGEEVGVGSFGELLASFELNRGNPALLEKAGKLSDSEYFNRKMHLTTGNADFDGNELNDTPPEPERLVPRFIFEPNTILSQSIENITVKLRLPYTRCSFIQQQAMAGYDEVAMNDMTDEINAIELSATKILFMCTYHGHDFLVQVNQFRNKEDDTKVFYKAFLAQGPDVLMPPETPEYRFKDEIFAYIAPIYAFLEGLAVGVYSLKREGARDISDRTPAPAKEGITYKVLRMIPDRPSQEYIPKGGTHASPREHERRAYTRMGRNGKVQHIPATTVNKGKTPGGLVIKDYNIKDPKK